MSEPEKLGQYEIVGKLGRGSFGTVYKGHDSGLGRDVAIKVCTLDDDGLRRRFFREAEISGRLQHPNVVGVYTFAEREGVPYLVQEYLDGEDLRAVVKRRDAWPLQRRLDTLIQIAEGLAYAHSQGVVHRDVKPANIRILPDGRVKIMDFGIAKLANDESQLTQKGVTMGTASYLPPEQVRGGDVDARADIFSFGVLAYELLTFERPFRGKTISALVYQILYKAPRPLAEVWAKCPKELSDLVSRCLEKDAEDRYADMDALLDELRSLRDGVAEGRWPALTDSMPPPPPRPTGDDPGSGASYDFVSKSQMVRAVETIDTEVDESPGAEPVDDGSKTRRIPASEMPTGPMTRHDRDLEAGAKTQRIDAADLPSPAVAAGADTAKTQRIDAADLPGPSAPTEPSGEGDEALATSAHEISKLVSEGHLEAAMEQLEETMTAVGRRSAPAPPPLPASVGATDRIDAEAPTRPLPQDQLEQARQRAASPKPPASKPPASKPPTPPKLPEKKSPAPAASATPPPLRAPKPPRKPAESPAASSRSSLRETFSSIPPKLLVVGGAVAALLVVIALLVVGFGGDEEPEAPAPEPVATLPEPVPPPPALPDRGVLLVRATPWARVIEVARLETPADAESAGETVGETGEATAGEAGDLIEPVVVERLVLPGNEPPPTPLRLDLPPGRYRVTLELPESAGLDAESVAEEDLVCDVTVREDEEIRCDRVFGDPQVIDLFKDNGWWS